MTDSIEIHRRRSKQDVLIGLRAAGIVAVFNAPDDRTAIEIARALCDGGITALEVTNRGDHCLEIFIELEKWSRRHRPECLVGVGSVVDAQTALAFVNAGAEFVVGPAFVASVASECARRQVPYAPGCGTVTEMLTATAAGCDVVKAFPAGALGGSAFVRSVLGPCPWLQIMPTGGVGADASSVQEMFEAGAFALGLGSNLVRGDLVNTQQWDALSDIARSVLAAVPDRH